MSEHLLCVHEYCVIILYSYWSKLYGDGELTWGRTCIVFSILDNKAHVRNLADPDLTDIGMRQAMDAHAAWEAERQLEVGIPLPEKLYCSPMTRALHTHIITFKGIITEENRKRLVSEV
jgi:hypothetical protein